MDYIVGKEYIISGSLTSLNFGEEFSNITILTPNNGDVNIKVIKDILSDGLLKEKELYVFNTKATMNERGKVVLSLLTFYKAYDYLSNDEIDELYDFFYPDKQSNIKKDLQILLNYFKRIKNPIFKKVTKTILDKYMNKFKVYPAGLSMHHSYPGGLLHHTVCLLKNCDAIANTYDYLNLDLLFSGIILHDLFKIEEISGYKGSYTTKGQLIGHSVLGYGAIAQIANRFNYNNTEEVLLLEHLLLSHHGELQYGASKNPMIPEAVLLWYVDNIDARLSELKGAFKTLDDGKWTGPIRVCDRIRFYKSTIKK